MITITGGQMPISGGTMTGALAITGGSAAAPGLAVADDANTGLFAPAADVLAIATGGVERVRFGATGNVGIGTSPGYKLDVAGNVNILVNNALTLNGSSASMMGRSGGLNDGRIEFKGYTGFQFFTFTNSAYEAKATLDNIGNIGIGTIAPGSLLHALLTSTATAAATNVLTIGHNTTGTAANGFGVGQLFTLQSSTTAAQSAARIQALWNDATHATRKADLVLTAFDSGGEREGVRVRGAGSEPALGFYGVTPVVRALLATGTGATVDNVITALQNLGLVKQA